MNQNFDLWKAVFSGLRQLHVAYLWNVDELQGPKVGRLPSKAGDAFPLF